MVAAIYSYTEIGPSPAQNSSHIWKPNPSQCFQEPSPRVCIPKKDCKTGDQPLLSCGRVPPVPFPELSPHAGSPMLSPARQEFSFNPQAGRSSRECPQTHEGRTARGTPGRPGPSFGVPWLEALSSVGASSQVTPTYIIYASCLLIMTVCWLGFFLAKLKVLRKASLALPNTSPAICLGFLNCIRRLRPSLQREPARVVRWHAPMERVKLQAEGLRRRGRTNRCSWGRLEVFSTWMGLEELDGD